MAQRRAEPLETETVDSNNLESNNLVHSGAETNNVVALAHPSEGVTELDLDEDAAEFWDVWSEQIGTALLPILEDLAKSIATFNSAMICTADGFNLCTLGTDEAASRKLSALTSSMHSLADAISQAVHDDEDRRLDRLTLTNGKSTTVVLAIRNLMVGKLLLWVTAEAETLGVLLVRCQQAAASIRAILEVEE